MRRDSLAVPGKTFGHLFFCVCFSKELKNVSNLLDIHWTVEVHKNEQKEKCPFAAQQIIYFIYDYSCAAALFAQPQMYMDMAERILQSFDRVITTSTGSVFSPSEV